MALLTVEISESLLAKLKRTGRPAQEVIVEALEQVLENAPPAKTEEPTRDEIAQWLIESGVVRHPDEYKPASQKARQRTKRNPELQDLPREEVVRRLLEAGLIRESGSWDNEFARAWRNRSEEEQQQLIKEMEETFFPDSFASRLIAENRR